MEMWSANEALRVARLIRCYLYAGYLRQIAARGYLYMRRQLTF